MSVTQIGINFINEIAEYFSESKGILSLVEIEHELTSKVQACVCDLPQREGIIRQAAGYLNNQIDGVAICAADPEANNGGCSEPHVSHILAGRLSSRPMAWSSETLNKLAPMLANGGNVELCRERQPQELLFLKAVRAASTAFKRIRFAPDPRAIGALQPINIGKRSSLHFALRRISQFMPL